MYVFEQMIIKNNDSGMVKGLKSSCLQVRRVVYFDTSLTLGPMLFGFRDCDTAVWS